VENVQITPSINFFPYYWKKTQTNFAESSVYILRQFVCRCSRALGGRSVFYWLSF